MSALPNARKRRSPAEVVSQWWQSWTSNAPASDLACCAEGEVERIAKDIGMPASEIRRLANLGPESAELLSRRMAALHLDRKEVAQTHPQTFGISSAFARCAKVTGSARAILRAIRATRDGRNIARTSQRCER